MLLKEGLISVSSHFDFPWDAAVCFSSALSLRPAIVISPELAPPFILSLLAVTVLSVQPFFVFLSLKEESLPIFLHQSCPPCLLFGSPRPHLSS